MSALSSSIEAVAQEVAPFGIECTLVEPGATRTSFGAALVSPPVMPAYEKTPAGDVRRLVSSGGFPIRGDVVKMSRAIIESVDRTPAPRRLALGSDTYRDVQAALAARLARLDEQKELALSMDLDG